jgi:hypothetical protein
MNSPRGRAEELDPRPQARGVLAVRHAGRPPRRTPSIGELRLFHNLFLPSVKLLGKERVGARVRRRYDAPRTPLERVQAWPEANPQAVAALVRLRDQLDPFALTEAIDRKIARLVALATPAQAAGVPPPTAASFPLIVPAAPPPRPGRPPGVRDFTFGNRLRRPQARPPRFTC